MNQGFSWRPFSVSFLTLENGVHDVQVEVVEFFAKLDKCVLRAIEVPFVVDAHGAVEFGGIGDLHRIEFSEGEYTLRYEVFSREASHEPRVRLSFSLNGSKAFNLLRADRELAVSGALLTEARPAL